MTKASRRITTARPSPNCWSMRSSLRTKAPKTNIMMAAAAVMTLPVEASPSRAYRIIQESLTNAVKHSGARHVAVKIHHDTRELTLRVQDDGHGATRSRHGGDSGIKGMTERAGALGER